MPLVGLCLTLTVLNLVTILGVILILVKFPMTRQSNLIEKQLATITGLTNLAASKDLATYAQLQATTIPTTMNDPLAFEPRDDESLAKALAAKYSEQGIDPNLAFVKEDDPIHDFGGPQAFV